MEDSQVPDAARGSSCESRYRLLDGHGRTRPSPGRFGGHRAGRICGRLDCPAALRARARGGYARRRVFFADEATALAAGYRPRAVCLPDRYGAWTAERAGGR